MLFKCYLSNYTIQQAIQNKLANPVYFIIDEMANIGKIAGIKMLGTCEVEEYTL